MNETDLTHFARLGYNNGHISLIFSLLTWTPYGISFLPLSPHSAKNPGVAQAELSGLLLPNRTVSPVKSWPLFWLIFSCCCHSALLWKRGLLPLLIHNPERVTRAPAPFPSSVHIHLTDMWPNATVQAGRKDSSRGYYSTEKFPICGPETPSISLQ